jgi:hypothetical protein
MGLKQDFGRVYGQVKDQSNTYTPTIYNIAHDPHALVAKVKGVEPRSEELWWMTNYMNG